MVAKEGAYASVEEMEGARNRVMVSPIIVGTCGTSDSDGAVRLAQLFAQRDGRPVSVVGVLERDYLPMPGTRGEPAYDTRSVEVLLASIARQLARLGVPEGRWPVNIVVEERTGALGNIAGDDRRSLLLVGQQGHATLRRIWERTPTLAPTRNASTTVLAVNQRAKALPRCAVVGTAFGVASKNAARAALECVGSFGSLHLVHVRPFMSQIGVGALSADVAYAQEIADRMEVMEAALEAPPGVQVRCHDLSGDPGRRLLEVARREQADLIAVGAHERPTFGSSLVGTVASHVLGLHGASVLIASA